MFEAPTLPSSVCLTTSSGGLTPEERTTPSELPEYVETLIQHHDFWVEAIAKPLTSGLPSLPQEV